MVNIWPSIYEHDVFKFTHGGPSISNVYFNFRSYEPPGVGYQISAAILGF